VTVAGVALAGALGALARYGLSNVIGSRDPRAFPTATFVVNISGSFVLGLLAVLLTERFVAHASLRTSLTVGFLGAYTTFSTFSLETFRLLDHGAVALATAYVAASVIVGVLAAYLGVLAARAV
jgi:fluoride exporter